MQQARYAVPFAQRRYETVDPEIVSSPQSSRPAGTRRSPTCGHARRAAMGHPGSQRLPQTAGGVVVVWLRTVSLRGT
jgi:hypothetical protein